MNENPTTATGDYSAATLRAKAAENLNEWAGVFMDALIGAASAPVFHASISFSRHAASHERNQIAMTGVVHQRKVHLNYDHVIIKKSGQLGGRIRFSLVDHGEEKTVASVIFDTQGNACFEGENAVMHRMKLSAEGSLVRRPTAEGGSLEELQRQTLNRLIAGVQKHLDTVEM